MNPNVLMLKHRMFLAQDALNCAINEIARCQRTEKRLSSGGYPISPAKLETFKETCQGHMKNIYRMQGVMHKLRWRIGVLFGKSHLTLTCTEARFYDEELQDLLCLLQKETQALNNALMKARYADDDFSSLPILWRIVKMNMGEEEWKRNFQNDDMWNTITSTYVSS